jgi:hypothetical protein
MKTLFTFALAGALSFSSLATNAADDLTALSGVQAKFKKINVLLKEGVGEAKIAILDPSGKRLHQQKVKVSDNDVIFPYNLDKMPCGEYQVKITTDLEEVTYSVETFEKPKSAAEFPLMAYGKKINENTVSLTVIGLDEPGVEVRIKSQKGNGLIHKESIDMPEGFKKDYKLKGVSPEEVYFEVTDSKGRFRTISFE